MWIYSSKSTLGLSFRVIFGVLLAVGFVSVTALDVGDPAPAWVNPDLQGEYVFSRDYYGTSPVLLDFYATWCVNCNEKLPEIEALSEKYSEMGLKVLLFATDKEGNEVVESFFKENPTTLPVLIDRYLVTLNKKFGENSVPVYYLIGADGIIVYKGLDVDELSTSLSELFEE